MSGIVFAPRHSGRGLLSIWRQRYHLAARARAGAAAPAPALTDGHRESDGCYDERGSTVRHTVEIALGWIAVAGILAVVALIVAVTIATIRNPSVPGERGDSSVDVSDGSDRIS
jgi:hypothetical protein